MDGGQVFIGDVVEVERRGLYEFKVKLTEDELIHLTFVSNRSHLVVEVILETILSHSLQEAFNGFE